MFFISGKQTIMTLSSSQTHPNSGSGVIFLQMRKTSPVGQWDGNDGGGGGASQIILLNFQLRLPPPKKNDKMKNLKESGIEA